MVLKRAVMSATPFHLVLVLVIKRAWITMGISEIVLGTSIVARGCHICVLIWMVVFLICSHNIPFIIVMARELVWLIAVLSEIYHGKWTHGSKYRMFVSFVFWFEQLSDLLHLLLLSSFILATVNKLVRWKKVYQELLLQTLLGESSASYTSLASLVLIVYPFWFDSDS